MARLTARHRLGLAYGGILLLAAGLRFVGLEFGQSAPWGRPDEEIFAQIGMRLFGEDNPHVAEGGWPEAWFRVHHWVQVLLRAYWTERYGQDVSLGCVFALDSERLLVPLRWLAAGFATATVGLVMRLGWLATPRTFAPGERHAVALSSGLFYCVNVLASRDAHFAVSDQPLIFFMTWMLIAAVRGLERGWLVDFFTCGVALGLAIACKWTGLPFALVPVIALGVRLKRHGAEPRNAAAILLGVGGALGAFVLTNPTFLDSPSTFLEGATSVALRYDPNAPRAFSIYPDVPIEFGITRHARVSFPFALGWPLTIVGALGALGCIGIGLRKRAPSVFLIGFWTLFFHAAIVGRTTLYFARYSLPAHPTACVGAGVLIVLLARFLSRRRFEKGEPGDADFRRRAWIAAVISVLLAFEPAFRSVEMTRILARPDTRDRATAWLRAHAHDEPIDMLGGYSRMIGLDDRVADACEARLPPAFGAPPALRLQGAPDSTRLITDRPASWHPLGAELVYWGLLHNASTPTAHWVAVAQPWLPCGQPVSRFAAYDPPERCYHEVARFEPEGVACDATWDDQDHFYMPLWGFTRPWWPSSPEAAQYGPSVVIYERSCP